MACNRTTFRDETLHFSCLYISCPALLPPDAEQRVNNVVFLFRFSFYKKDFISRVTKTLTETHVFTERNKTLTLVFLLLILNKRPRGGV